MYVVVIQIENRLSTVTKNGVTESYAYDADGSRTKEVTSGATTYSFFPGLYEEKAANNTETVWVEDALPTGAVPAASGGDSWSWITSPKYSGSKAHASANAAGAHQHYFTNATQTLVVSTNDILYAWVYVDPASPPRQVMLQWNDGSWEHRAYWGENLFTWGTDGTNSRRSMGPLPKAGGWVRLEVPAAAVGLAGSVVTGMAFSLYDGKATWDRAGKFASTITKYYTFNGMTIAMKEGSTLRYLHSDHLSSNTLVTNADGTLHSSQNYCAYGGKRTATWYGSECDPTAVNPLPTDRTFTGQEQDGTGLMFYHARYYDGSLGTFISPDTMVPEPGVVADYNRFAYVRGNPLGYSDPSGHCATNDDGSRSQDDGECWDLADTIYAMWDADAWWQEHFGVDRDYFMQNLAGLDVLNTTWMQGQMDAWWYDFTWRTGLPHPDRLVEWNQPPPQPVAPRLTDIVTGRCEIVDCTGLVIDVVSFVGAIAAVGASAICGPGAPGCAAVLVSGGKAVGTSATLISAGRTVMRIRSGEASNWDGPVTTVTTIVSLTPLAPVAGITQITWDIAGPPPYGQLRGR